MAKMPGLRSALDGAVPSFCALAECTRLLQLTIAMQLARFMEGDYRRIPELDTLYKLQELIQYGVCRKTRTLEVAEMPGMQRLIESLPLPWQRRLIDAIIGEHTGQVGHELPIAQVQAQDRALVATNPQMRAVRPPQRPQ